MMANAELYEYAVEAKDPEGEAVSFELEIGPPGMVIDKASGRVVWNVPSSLKGAHHVKIVVGDVKGARSWRRNLICPYLPIHKKQKHLTPVERVTSECLVG